MAYGDGDNGGSAEIALEAMLMAFEATMVVAIKSQTLIVEDTVIMIMVTAAVIEVLWRQR